ncbi:MAG: APC family permease [Bacteriovoracaceae bacterium]
MGFSQIKRIFIGDPLSTEMAAHEHIPKWKALAVLSSDALSSVAYATEEILIPLSLLSIAAMAWSIPIAIAVGLLLLIITLSYRQTIDAYPNGGGAYTVAKENLGEKAGLVAGAALLIDYILTVAVSVSSGVENIASAVPFIAEHKVMVGCAIVFFIMMLNLRGIKESASIFALPTYLFIASFLIMIGTGFYKYFTGQILEPAPIIHEAYPVIPLFLLLRAFSSGCAALTGIEAISNGIPIFKHPAQKNAKTTMLWMAIILGVFFLSITLLAHILKIVPEHGQTAVSLLAKGVFGDNFFYYIIQGSTALILLLAANTSYADFPRLSSLLAGDRFLPRQLTAMGDRLVFSHGIMWLSGAAAFLIIIFKGTTHHLIPLYAVGVFLSFTLSQSGMIVHHIKLKEKGWIPGLILNATGALTTFIILIVIAMTKFFGGAWIVIILIPSAVFVFMKINKHYKQVAKQLSSASLGPKTELEPFQYTVIVPVSGIHPGVIEALRYALTVSKDVRACYVEMNPAATERMRREWGDWAQTIPLVVLNSPYRSVIQPLLDYVDSIPKTNEKRVTVVIPEFVTSKWYHQFLHNQTSLLLRASLRLRRGKALTVIRYYLD